MALARGRRRAQVLPERSLLSRSTANGSPAATRGRRRGFDRRETRHPCPEAPRGASRMRSPDSHRQHHSQSDGRPRRREQSARRPGAGRRPRRCAPPRPPTSPTSDCTGEPDRTPTSSAKTRPTMAAVASNATPISLSHYWDLRSSREYSRLDRQQHRFARAQGRPNGDRSREDGEEMVLGQELTDDAGSRRSQGSTKRSFPCIGDRRSGENEVRQVIAAPMRSTSPTATNQMRMAARVTPSRSSRSGRSSDSAARHPYPDRPSSTDPR